MYFLFLECCGIVSNILENSFSLAMDIKLGWAPEEGRVASSQQSTAIIGLRIGLAIFTGWIWRDSQLQGRIQKMPLHFQHPLW